MRTTHLLSSTLFLILAGVASAGPVYQVTLDTAAMGLSGDDGSLDFVFDASPGSTQSATVQIVNFTGASYIAGSQVDTGSASGGPLPSAITIIAGNPDSDDFEAVTFGSTLTFDVAFSGPAVDSTNGTATGPTVFSLEVFSDELGSVPANTTDPSTGIAGTITVNDDGALTAAGVSPDFSAQAIPEPSTMGMVLGALAMLIGGRFARRSKRSV
jgi:hypothetical protein